MKSEPINRDNSKIRVAFIFHEVDRNNGANHSMMDVIDYMASSGEVEPVIVFPKPSGTAIEYAKSRRYTVITRRYGQWNFTNGCKDLSELIYKFKRLTKIAMTIPTLFLLGNQLRTLSVSIVYSNTMTNFLGAWLSRWFHFKHIWHIREFGEEDHHFHILGGDTRLYRYFNRYTDYIYFISNSVMQKFEPYIVDKSKFEVAYNDILPVEVDRFKRWDNLHIIYMLIAGTIQPGKGQLDVVKALEILIHKYGLTNIRLQIAGACEGEYFQQVQRYVVQNKIEKFVEFLGFVENMNEIRATTHFGIVASSSEAFGRVTIEGMLTGMVMIGADAAGTSELINSGSNGFLYPVNDSEKLAEILFDCITHPAEMSRVGERGFKYASQNFARHKTGRIIGEKIRQLQSGMEYL